MRRKKADMFFREPLHLDEMTEKLSTLDELHEEVNAMFILEDELHVH